MREAGRDRAPGPKAGSQPESELAARLADLQALHRGLAHELRRPLNTIVLQLELLRSDLEDGAPAGVSQTRVERLERELEELRAGIEGLLSLLEPPEGSGPEWDAAELAAVAARLLVPQARLRQVTVEPPLGAPPLPTSGDRGQVLAVLLRLGLDGLAALPEGSRLAVGAAAGESGADVVYRLELDATSRTGGCRDVVVGPATEAAVGALGGELGLERPGPARIALGLRLTRTASDPSRQERKTVR